MDKLTQFYLKECIHYNPSTGDAMWKTRPVTHFKSERDSKIWNSNNAGNDIFCKGNNGYLKLSINSKQYSLHRIAFLYVDGEMPVNQVDHIDRNRLNNTFSNLRHATAIQNAQNQPIRSNNTSGIKGVFWNSSRGKWCARITVNKKVIFLGYHTEKLKAKSARKAAEIKYNFYKES